MGFQATNLGKAINIVNDMLAWRLSDETPEYIDKMCQAIPDEDLVNPQEIKCTIFLSYTSNMISCGAREIIRYLVQHKMVSCIVTTAGGIEEDFMKCMNPHRMGDFHLDGDKLRKQGLNRIGNLLVPNKNYCDLETWILPIFDKMLVEQKSEGTVWTPSKFIARLGKEINHEDSVYYWAYKNNIPVFCPALTDGSLGDMLYFHAINNPGLVVDIVQDISRINNIALKAPKSGCVILGGGVVKHHVCNANLMRNGCDYSVFINTGQEFDGSDSGARPDEAISWGKVKAGSKAVKVHGDATIMFPILVAQSFAKVQQQSLSNKSSVNNTPSTPPSTPPTSPPEMQS